VTKTKRRRRRERQDGRRKRKNFRTWNQQIRRRTTRSQPKIASFFTSSTPTT